MGGRDLFRDIDGNVKYARRTAHLGYFGSFKFEMKTCNEGILI